MQETQRRLGERIRNYRRKKGWSQEELANVSGLHRTYVGSVERGEKNLTLSTLQTIAKTLGISISQLLRGIA